MTLPITTKEPVRFTPARLAERADAPVFVLRVPSLRERIALDAAIAAEGVRYPPDSELAQALRDGIAAHVLENQWPELLAYVEELEAAAMEGIRPGEELRERIEEIARTLRPHHRALAEIDARRGEYLATAMLVRAELLLIGIEGEDALPVQRRSGRLTEACAEAIEARYGEGTLIAIGARTLDLTSPSSDAAKNSGSPAPLPSGPAISTAAKPPRTGRNGKSSASAISETLGSA
jgi:hypothetical protein